MRQTDPKRPPKQVEPGGESRNPASYHSNKSFSRCAGVQVELLFNELLVFPGGGGEAALRRIIEEQDELVVSKPILDESLGILARKFYRDAEELSRVAVFMSTLATFVSPRRRLRVVKDYPENRVLECALTGRAQAIVTGDHALLALENFRGVRLLSLHEYVDRRTT